VTSVKILSENFATFDSIILLFRKGRTNISTLDSTIMALVCDNYIHIILIYDFYYGIPLVAENDLICAQRQSFILKFIFRTALDGRYQKMQLVSQWRQKAEINRKWGVERGNPNCESIMLDGCVSVELSVNLDLAAVFCSICFYKCSCHGIKIWNLYHKRGDERKRSYIWMWAE